MKKNTAPTAPAKEKKAKHTPDEKAQRKADKAARRATAELDSDRVEKKSGQKKALKVAAKQLQKELNGRMNEMVARIRKETKDKLKEVVKEATRRLDGDTERMFEQALHTIVQHYDSVAPQSGGNSGHNPNGRKKGQKLNKDGSPRKTRTARATATASDTNDTHIAPKRRGRQPGAAAAATATTSSPARRGRKPAVASAAEAAAPKRRGPQHGSPTTGARRGRKPGTPASTVGGNNLTNSDTSPGTGETVS